MLSRWRASVAWMFFAVLLNAILAAGQTEAQNNPVPQIVGPVHPSAVAPGSGEFTLHVYGANFVPGSVVNWNYQPRTTTYVSAHEVQAQILATDIENNTAGYITVTNPAPGGGSSSASWAQVELHHPVSSISFNQPVFSNFGFWQLQAADFNHDAILDLLGECYGLCLELGVGNGTFRVPTTVDATNLSPTQFGYGDFNNDGNIDVMSFSAVDAVGYAPTRMRMLFGGGNGHFRNGAGLTGSGYNFDLVTVGDFNQDGNLDLITKAAWVTSYLGNGDGTFRLAEVNTHINANQTVLLSGDIDGDGILDLVVGNEANAGAGTGPLSFAYLKGNGDGTFQKPRNIISLQDTNSCGFQGPAQLSDFNGDGKLDLAICTLSQIVVMLGNGDGTFRLGSAVGINPDAYGDFTFAVGDINSDGKQDLLVYGYYDTFQLVVFLGNGDGTFQEGQPVDLSSVPSAELGIQAGDLNNDGQLDLMFQNAGGMFLLLQQ